jgi:heat shock protein HslJ
MLAMNLKLQISPLAMGHAMCRPELMQFDVHWIDSRVLKKL